MCPYHKVAMTQGHMQEMVRNTENNNSNDNNRLWLNHRGPGLPLLNLYCGQRETSKLFKQGNKLA